MRYYLTTDDAARVAPVVTRYFEGQVLPNYPEVAKAIGRAKQQIDVYRAQGSLARAQQQLVSSPGRLVRAVRAVREFFGRQTQVEQFDPLRLISQAVRDKTGAPLAPSEDPYLLASWKRGAAGATVDYMVNHGMIDPWGNPTGPSLRQALAPVVNRSGDFQVYLYARRALELWESGRNPGITPQDAQFIVDGLRSPEFELAAQAYYEWNNGLLEYVAAANPALGPTVAAIRASTKKYVPLARVIDPTTARMADAASRSNPLQRLRGSGRQVKDIFESTLANAARLVSMSHRNMVLEAVVGLSERPGMGHLVEEVPRDRVPTQVNIEKLREELEAMGVDTSTIPEDTILTSWGLAEQPRGVDPVLAVRRPDGIHWYHIRPDVYELVAGMETYSLRSIPHIGGVVDLLVGTPARLFKLGTTGLRPSFSLITNPARDLRTFIGQTASHANPAKLAAAYFTALGEVVSAGLGRAPSAHVDAFHRLAAQLGQPLGGDIDYTRKAARGLFHGRTMRIVRSPVEHLRELLGITESAPRVAELKLIAEEVGWVPGTPMSPDQAVQIALAAKRVTVDFSAAGEVSRVINQVVPFYNATVQGTRSFARALRDRPARAVLSGLAAFTVPALVNWWRNRDEEWYKNLPWRERYLYDNVADKRGNVWQIPRPPEWANMFSVLPEAMLDSWYRADPAGASGALEAILNGIRADPLAPATSRSGLEGGRQVLATQNPFDWPVPLRVARDQWRNRIEFFDRPIVPRGQVDLPPGEQRGPYTTHLAALIGDAFPNTASPRRIDAAVRAFLGGAVPDLQQALETAGARLGMLPPPARPEREPEPADLVVIGRAFRHGGQFSAQSQSIADYYDDLTTYSAKLQAARQAWNQGRQPAAAMESRAIAYAMALEAERPYFRAGHDLANATTNANARQVIYRDLARTADRLVKLRP